MLDQGIDLDQGFVVTKNRNTKEKIEENTRKEELYQLSCCFYHGEKGKINKK